MAATTARLKQVKDFSADEFAEWLRMECSCCDGNVNLMHQGLTDESIAQLAKGLLKLFLGSPGDGRDGDGDGGDGEDVSPLTLKRLSLGFNDFGGDGLGALAEVLSRLRRCRETLEELNIPGNQKVTTLAPLAAAGTLEGLKRLYAHKCSLSGESSVLPPELCANLPALEGLWLNSNTGGAPATLTVEALCALPAECKVVLRGSSVQVACPSAEDGEMGLVALPTASGEEFGALGLPDVKTVADICAFAGVQRVTLVKPARP